MPPKKSKTTDKGADNNDDEGGNAYMNPTAFRLTEDLSQDTPSLEKHGLWLFPASEYEELEEDGERNERTPEDTDSAPSSVEQSSVEHTSKSSKSHRSVLKYGYPCCFQPPPCCCCSGCPSKMIKYYRGPQTQNQRGIQSQRSTYADRKTSKNKESKKYGEPESRSVLEELAEMDGVKDMELASIVINDAKSNFKKAIKEQKGTEYDRRKAFNPSNREMDCIMLTQSNDTWILNRAEENFGNLAKEEKRKNEQNSKMRKKSSTSPAVVDVTSQASRGNDCIMLTQQRDDTWIVNNADAQFDELAKREMQESARRVKTAPQRTVQFEEECEQESGTDKSSDKKSSMRIGQGVGLNKFSRKKTSKR